MSAPQPGWSTVPRAAAAVAPITSTRRTARSRVARALLALVAVLVFVACGLLTVLAIVGFIVVSLRQERARDASREPTVHLPHTL